MTAFDWGKWRRCSNSQSGIQAYLGWRRRGRRPRWLGPSTPAASPAYQAHTVSQKNDIFIDWKFYLWNLKHLFFSCFLVSTIFHTAVLPWNAEVWRCSMLKEAWKFGARERIAKVTFTAAGTNYYVYVVNIVYTYGVLGYFYSSLTTFQGMITSQVAGSFHHSSIPARNSDAHHEKKPKRLYLMPPGRHLLSQWNPFKRVWFNG